MASSDTGSDHVPPSTRFIELQLETDEGGGEEEGVGGDVGSVEPSSAGEEGGTEVGEEDMERGEEGEGIRLGHNQHSSPCEEEEEEDLEDLELLNELR
jgi:hypothetical protein